MIGDIAARRFRSGEFGRNVFAVAGGTAIGQGLLVLVSPLLTRLYHPSDFGVLGVYTALLSIVVAVVSLRYEVAITLPTEEDDAATLLLLSSVLVFCVSLLTAVACLLARGSLTHWVGSGGITPFLVLLPLGIVGAGLCQALSYYAVRHGSYKTLGLSKLSQGAAEVAFQVGLPLLGFGVTGLLLGDVLGWVAAALAFASLVIARTPSLRIPTARSVLVQARRYRRFPLLSGPSALVNAAGLYVPLILFAATYGLRVAGWFALALRVFGVPMAFLGQSISQVYMGEFARIRRGGIGREQELFKRTLMRLLLAGALPIVLLGLAAPWIFSVVFGESWRVSGVYAQILTAAFLAQFVVVPLSQTLNLLERQHVQLAWDIVRLVAVLGSVVGAYALGMSDKAAVAAFSGSMASTYILLGWLSAKAVFSASRELARTSRELDD